VKELDHSIVRGVEGSRPIVTLPLGTSYAPKELRIKSEDDWARTVWVLIDL
jgi:hypothetical protein